MKMDLFRAYNQPRELLSLSRDSAAIAILDRYEEENEITLAPLNNYQLGDVLDALQGSEVLELPAEMRLAVLRLAVMELLGVTP